MDVLAGLQIAVWVIYGLCLAFIFCYSLVQLQLTGLYLLDKRKSRHSTTSLPDPPNWPTVTVQLPIYNEIYVAERVIDAVMAFDYPPDKLQVQVLDDSTDETKKITAAKVSYYRSLGRDIHFLHRTNRLGYKAGALQAALPGATGTFISIFDADFLPPTDFLKKVIPAFDAPEIGVVQTRWGHLNRNYSLLTQLQAFALDAHFTIEQTGRNSGHHFINFNGTAGVWRQACIWDAGGWQPDTLTEDLDLSYRAQLRNWKFKSLEHLEAPAELPAAMPALKSQQFRWTKGAAETARKNMGKLLGSQHTIGTKLNGLFHLLNSSIFICVLLSAILSLPVLIMNHQYNNSWSSFLQFKALFIISLLSLISFYGVAYWHIPETQNRSLGNFLFNFFMFLCLTMGLSLHNSIAVAEGYLGIKTPFIRTPKYNLRSSQDTWQTSLYTIKNISLLTYVEGFLSLYFLVGGYLAFKWHHYGMLPLHFMLSIGFGIIAYFSIKHSR